MRIKTPACSYNLVALSSGNHLGVNSKVALYNCPVRKQPIDSYTASGAINFADPPYRRHQSIYLPSDESGYAVFDNLRNSAAGEAQYGGAAGHGFCHYKSKWLLPQNGHEKRARASKKC